MLFICLRGLAAIFAITCYFMRRMMSTAFTLCTMRQTDLGIVYAAKMHVWCLTYPGISK